MFDERLAQIAQRFLLSDPPSAMRIAMLYDLTLPNFLRANMGHILPNALAAQDESILQSLTENLGLTDEGICKSGAHHLFVSFFMSADDNYSKHGLDRLKSILGSEKAVLTLLQGHRTKVTSFLAMRLADTDRVRLILLGAIQFVYC